jgi:hypothetical protein
MRIFAPAEHGLKMSSLTTLITTNSPHIYHDKTPKISKIPNKNNPPPAGFFSPKNVE